MNSQEKRQMMYFPKALDEAVNAKFGAEVDCHTELDLVNGGHVTYYRGEGVLKSNIEIFIEAYKQGNIELRERLLNKDKWL